MYYPQLNSKFRLYGNRNKTFNHMIRECIKVAQNERLTRHGDPQLTKQEIKIYSYYLIVKTRIRLTKMSRINFSGTLRYKRITESRSKNRLSLNKNVTVIPFVVVAINDSPRTWKSNSKSEVESKQYRLYHC